MKDFLGFEQVMRVIKIKLNCNIENISPFANWYVKINDFDWSIDAIYILSEYYILYFCKHSILPMSLTLKKDATDIAQFRSRSTPP
jgi:hypothetical protein